MVGGGGGGRTWVGLELRHRSNPTHCVFDGNNSSCEGNNSSCEGNCRHVVNNRGSYIVFFTY